MLHVVQPGALLHNRPMVHQKMAKETMEEQIGERIRALRQQRNVTLGQLADEAQLTKGQVSRIENGKVSSPVSTLTRLASALGVSPGFFFQSPSSTPRATLVRKAERKVIAGRGSKIGHRYESLAHGLPFEKDFEPYLMTIEEKKIVPAKNIFRHPGHELLFMLQGGMDYRHNDRIYHLEPGDSLFFDATLEHGPMRVHNPPVQFLSIISNVKSPAAGSPVENGR
jgi:transcriptional regulator with XRE-family HTH domain